MFRHNAYYSTPLIGARLRTGLIFLLFSKLSSISQYILKSSEVNKVANMLSNDFNLI